MDQPPSTPKEPRGPVSLRIKFRSASLDQFIERYAVDVSRGGIFIRTREPLAVGTQLRFDFQLQDAAPLLAGEGTVVWIRENDPNRAGVTPGMGVRFDKLTPTSQPTLERILAEKVLREQGRRVLELEIELELRAHGERLARADEDAAAAHVDAVAFDELLEAGAAELDPQAHGTAGFFGGRLIHGRRRRVPSRARGAL